MDEDESGAGIVWIVLAVIVVAGGFFFFLGNAESERFKPVMRAKPTLVKSVAVAPEVTPVQVPKPPEKTSGEKKPPVDTAWDKDGDGVVDEGFTGIKYEWYESNKVMSKTPYKSGELNGVQYIYTETGQVEIMTNFRNGLEVGLQVLNFEDGLKKENFFKEGGNLLWEKEFDKNGILEVKYIYQENKNLKRIYYYPNGNKKEEWEQVPKGDGTGYGNRTGNESRYSESGQLTYQTISDGNNGSTVIYDKAKGIDKR